MKKIRKVFVAGPANAARAAMVRRLQANGLEPEQIETQDEAELNICDQLAVRSYLRKSSPEQIYITAGPWNNPADSHERRGSYMVDALLGPVQLIHEALYAGVRELLFVASHQVYGNSPILPLAEEDLSHARLDQVRNPLAIAHTAGIRLCEAYTHEFGEALGLKYRSVVVSNLYGPGDSHDPSKAGELQALIRHIHQAKLFKLSSVSIHSKADRRADWLYVDDMADGCIDVMGMPDTTYQSLTRPERSQLNLGSGHGCTTLELAKSVAAVVGYQGKLIAESALEKGRAESILDTQRMRSTGWTPQIGLDTGLERMYRDYKLQKRRVAAA